MNGVWTSGLWAPMTAEDCAHPEIRCGETASNYCFLLYFCFDSSTMR
jgi:hypothetical protein